MYVTNFFYKWFSKVHDSCNICSLLYLVLYLLKVVFNKCTMFIPRLEFRSMYVSLQICINFGFCNHFSVTIFNTIQPKHFYIKCRFWSSRPQGPCWPCQFLVFYINYYTIIYINFRHIALTHIHTIRWTYKVCWIDNLKQCLNITTLKCFEKNPRFFTSYILIY